MREKGSQVPTQSSATSPPPPPPHLAALLLRERSWAWPSAPPGGALGAVFCFTGGRGVMQGDVIQKVPHRLLGLLCHRNDAEGRGEDRAPDPSRQHPGCGCPSTPRLQPPPGLPRGQTLSPCAQEEPRSTGAVCALAYKDVTFSLPGHLGSCSWLGAVAHRGRKVVEPIHSRRQPVPGSGKSWWVSETRV